MWRRTFLPCHAGAPVKLSRAMREQVEALRECSFTPCNQDAESRESVPWRILCPEQAINPANINNIQRKVFFITTIT